VRLFRFYIARAPPFIIKEDTVTFNVSSYRDGSERKIEDITKASLENYLLDFTK
jgi:hypothetical protein